MPGKNKMFGISTIVLIVILFTFALSAADIHLATSVLASTGGKAGSADFQMKSTLGQSTPIGHSSNPHFEVSAGFWCQDPVAPSSIGDLVAKLSINNIVLQWFPAGDNAAIDHYVIYRGANPNFMPGSWNILGQTEGTSYLDMNAAKNLIINYFYLVKASDPTGNLAKESNRVGEFDKQMDNGMK